MNISKTTLTLAMTVALGAAGSASAAQSHNPFSMQQLDSGYVQLAEAKAKDGKCGANSAGMDAKAKDGSCGDKTSEEVTKAKDGKCGEGKCGANKAKAEEKVKEANCGADKSGDKS